MWTSNQILKQSWRQLFFWLNNNFFLYCGFLHQVTEWGRSAIILMWDDRSITIKNTYKIKYIKARLGVWLQELFRDAPIHFLLYRRQPCLEALRFSSCPAVSQASESSCEHYLWNRLREFLQICINSLGCISPIITHMCVGDDGVMTFWIG